MVRNTIFLLTLAVVLAQSACLSAGDQTAGEDAARMRMQARVAAEQGDFTAALKNLRQAAELSGDRRTVDRAQALTTEPQPAGGSPFANFSEILQLIQEQTSPPARWALVDGEGGALSISQQGVRVAAPAVLAALASIEDDSHLMQAAEFVRSANHNTDVRQQAPLRMVSLPRLEAHVAQLTKEGRPVPEDVRVIAGLTKIEYLFVYPETGDLVIAGPAGAWERDSDGRTVNTESHRPTLNLDDLITLTRTFSPQGTRAFVCTIDPKKEQVAALQKFVARQRRSLNPQTAAMFTRQAEQQLGLQNVYVKGVPADSHVASVIVEADYRMKQIGIGRRDGAEGMKSYFDLLTRSEQRGSASMDALRWWMAVGYDAINMSGDGRVFEFAGNAIQCLSENQILTKGGNRTGTGKTTGANARFADIFTEHMPQLVAQDAVFAELENIFDLSMVSALIHSHGLGQQVGWVPEAFTGNDIQTRSVDVPQELMTAAHFRVYDGRTVVVQVAGGVRVDVSRLVADRQLTVTSADLDGTDQKSTPLGQQGARWWWDASEK